MRGCEIARPVFCSAQAAVGSAALRVCLAPGGFLGVLRHLVGVLSATPGVLGTFEDLPLAASSLYV